jgi:hypothetical protein
MRGAAAQLYDIADGLDGEAQEAIKSIAGDLDGKQCGLRFEHLARLAIPRDYIGAVRQGLLRELKFVGEWLASQADEANRGLAAREHPDLYRPTEVPKAGFGPFDCIDGPLAHVQSNAEYLRQLEEEHEGDVTLSGEHHVLKHVAGATAHEQAAKHLIEVDFGGPEAVQAAAIVAWAAGEAERLEVELQAHAEREAVAA